MPPPIPSNPAAIPAKTHNIGYNAVVRRSHLKSPSRGSWPKNVFSVARSSVFLRIHAVAAINTAKLLRNKYQYRNCEQSRPGINDAPPLPPRNNAKTNTMSQTTPVAVQFSFCTSEPSLA